MQCIADDLVSDFVRRLDALKLPVHDHSRGDVFHVVPGIEPVWAVILALAALSTFVLLREEREPPPSASYSTA